MNLNHPAHGQTDDHLKVHDAWSSHTFLSRARERSIRWLFAAMMVLFIIPTSGCSLLVSIASDFGISVAPPNPGARLDLYVGDTTNVDRSTLAPVVTAALMRDANLSSWFVVVDRVARPSETLILETLFHGISRSTSQSGSRKYGFYTMYNTETRVTFSLVDAATGDVVTSVSATGSTSSRDGFSSADEHEVFERAVGYGLNLLVRQYAGS